MLKLNDVNLDDIDAVDLIFVWEQVISMQQFPEENDKIISAEDQKNMVMKYDTLSKAGAHILIQIPNFLSRKEKRTLSKLIRKFLLIAESYYRCGT